MNGRTRIGCGMLAGVVVWLLAPSAATATDCGLPGSPGTGMNEILNVQGDLASARTGGYLQIPFDVPAGTTGIQVRYSYDQPGGGCGGGSNTLDMGVYKPKANPASPAFEQTDRRGWSGSAVKNLAIAENGFTDETTYNAGRKDFVNGFTTRAYKPGPIEAGTWAVELGIAFVDPSDSDGIHYHVQVLQSSDQVWSNDPYSPSGPPDESVNSTPGWYTGDLHVHGEQEPGNATMTETFAAAFGPSGAGLDFITLVDHNNDTAHDDMQAQADVYPDDLVIPGTEVTTYRGHWNNQGSSNFADFRGGPVYALSDTATPPYDDSDLTHVQNATRPKKQFKGALDGGGWTQVNHPAFFRDDPAGCRGCAWSYSDEDTGFKRLDAIEIANSFGPLTTSPFFAGAIEYYEHTLDSGAHIAAVGSSDAHKAATDLVSHVGEGVTVVHADGLGKQAITDAVKADHTYVKPFGPSGPDVSLEAANEAGEEAIIGDSLSGQTLELTATVSGTSGTGRPGTWDLTLLQDGIAIDSTPIAGDGLSQDYDVSESGRYSIKVVRSNAGSDLVEDYTSPIWLTAEPKPSNRFDVGKPKLNKKKGTAKLPVVVPGAGKLRLQGKSVKDDSAKPKSAKTVKLAVRPQGKLKKKLRKHGKAKAKLSVAYTPSDGEKRKQKVVIKLKRR